MSELSKLFAPTGTKGDDLDSLFATPAAEPLPAGIYVVELIRGGMGQAKSGKPRYELRAKIVEGEHAGRALFDDLYLTPSAWWKTGPALKKLGITTTEQCQRDLPAGLLARVRLTIEEHDGTRRNKIADLTLIGRKPDDGAAPIAATPTPAPPPPAPNAAAIDPFAPNSAGIAGESEGGSPPATGNRGNSWEHPADRRLTADEIVFGPDDPGTVGPYAAGGERR